MKYKMNFHAISFIYCFTVWIDTIRRQNVGVIEDLIRCDGAIE